jgi:hypothetical protein
MDRPGEPGQVPDRGKSRSVGHEPGSERRTASAEVFASQAAEKSL